ncbi:MAG: ATP phosphoribosyltransferase regulatory subunit, partial [Blautia sp.]|nr:ATP phosphoribosyltransferase regulatory subunit [Blautia sp.]
GLSEFQISVGQVDYFKSLLQEADLPEEAEKRLRALISQKNDFGVSELMEELKVREDLALAFTEIPQMFGSLDILEKARSLTENPRALAAVDRLSRIFGLMCEYGYEKYISFDFAMVSKYQYYTGIIFQAYTYGTGEPVVKGGRYDELMKHFGKPAPSIGFAIVIDNLLLALQSQKIRIPESFEVETIFYTEEEQESALREARKRRAEGRNVRLCLRREGKGL